MSPNVQARIVDANVEIDPDESNDLGLSIPIKDLCRLCDIEYVGQPAQVKGDAVEIDPPRDGYKGVSLPIDAIRNFYKQ